MNEVTTQQSPVALFKKDLRQLNEAGELALPKSVPFENFRNAAVVAITDNPSILQCDKGSIFKAVRTLAAGGLVPDGREAAIVPFKGKAQAMPMVAGLVKIARNSGKIVSLWAEVVYEDETFTMKVEDGQRTFDHDYDPMGRKGGKVVGAYAVAKLTDGTIETLPMGRADIEKRRKASANQRNPEPTGIWADWYEEMAKKTVIRAICKTLPMSSDDMDRLMKEQEPLLKDVTPEPEAPEPNLAQRLTANADTAPHWTTEVILDDAFPGNEEWALGEQAFEQGRGRTSCPFENDREKAANWLAAYDTASEVASE